MNNGFLDSYCERYGDASLLAEPVNLFTNLAFVIAAILGLRLLKNVQMRHAPDCYALCVILACIGIGSGLWHLYPTSLTVMMDVIPIVLFINLYLVAFLWRAFYWNWWQIAAAIAGLQLANAALGILFSPDALNGTVMYLGTYAVLVLVTFYSWIRYDWFRVHLLLVTVLWTISLTFRTIDLPVCYHFSLGTHFLWHLANAVVLYKLLVILIGLAHYRR